MTITSIHSLLAFALIILVPLSIKLQRNPRDQPLVTFLGLVSSASFLIPEGVAAAAVAGTWFLTPSLVLTKHIRSWRSFSSFSILTLVPIGYLFVGAAWFVISRYGARPMGFSREIVELTAIHFHFAGFIAPILMRELGRWLDAENHPSTALAKAAYPVLLVATPVTAAGISFSPALGAIGAGLFATSLLVGATLILILVVPVTESLSAASLGISASSVIVSMVLAVAYSLGQWLGTPAPELSTMVWSHGLLNAMGFSFFGLLGWILVSRDRDLDSPNAR